MNKYRSILNLFIAINLTLPSHAQSGKALVGFEFGPGAGSIRGDTAFDNNQDPLLGYTGGLFVQFNSSKVFSLKTGFYYEQKGASFSMDFPDGTGGVMTATQKFKYDYLVVPLLAKFTFGSAINFFVNAGPGAAYLINSTSISEFDTQKETTDITENYNTFDFILAGGAGVGFLLGDKLSITAELRDNYGLTNIQKDQNSLETKTNTIFLLFGLGVKI